MGIDDIRKTARRSLHEFMGRPAFYYETPTSSPISTKARAHSKRGLVGDLPGTNLNYAQTFDRKETVVLWREDIPAPARGALIVFSATEAYWLDSIEPPDGQTVTAAAVSATAEELEGIRAP